MVATRFIETRDEMGTARAGCAGADAELAGKLGLTGGRKRGAFLVANADPFDVTAANRICERIKRIADQSKNVPDPNLLENADQNVGHSLSHQRLLLMF